jgi:hypothetical protein
MGYGVMAYSVDIDAVVAFCGSGDDQKRRVICGKNRPDITRFNEDFDLSNDRGADNLFTAIGHLVMGGEKTLDGYLYGYGFKYIVAFFGRYLDNGPFYPCPSTYIHDHIDPVIKATGAPISLTGLIFDGAPVSFPMPADFPGIGYWSAEECAASVEPLRTGTTDEVRKLAEWTAAASTAGRGIIGFYH